jgi:hypothetical protein
MGFYDPIMVNNMVAANKCNTKNSPRDTFMYSRPIISQKMVDFKLIIIFFAHIKIYYSLQIWMYSITL